MAGWMIIPGRCPAQSASFFSVSRRTFCLCRDSVPREAHRPRDGVSSCVTLE